MRLYSFILFYSYYFFKKQGRFKPLDLCSYVIPFYFAPLVFSVVIAIQKKSELLSPTNAVFFAIGLLVLFFMGQKKWLLVKAFNANKSRYSYLEKRSQRFIGMILLGSLSTLTFGCMALLIFTIK